MKKLILGAAMAMAFTTTALAQTDNKTQTSTPASTTESSATTPTTAAGSGIMMGGTPVSTGGAEVPATTTTTTTTTATAATQQPQPTADGKEYNKVTQNQIAPAVLKKAVAKYKDYSLVEALAATDGTQYKLVLTKDGKDIAAYYKPNGDFIKEETV